MRANRLPGSAATPSRIAAAFDTQHFHVMRAIRVLLDQMPPEDHASHFGLTMVEVDIGKGATRRDPAYRISRDGFGKQHSHVKRAIRALLEQMPPEDHQSNFGLMIVEVAIGSGASRCDPAYRLNFEAVTYLDEKRESPVTFRLPRIGPTVFRQVFAHLDRIPKIGFTVIALKALM